MNRFLPFFGLLAAIAQASAKGLDVVTTIPDLASIAQVVGGQHVRVSSIIVGARDPHRVEAKPSFMSRAARANLWLAVGLELEVGYEPLILEGSRNANIQVGRKGHVYVSDWVRVQGVPQGNVTRAMGDVHPFGNPHIWLDPFNMRVIADRLADKMAGLDPANARDYQANAKSFIAKLDEAMFGAAAVRAVGGESLWQWSSAGTLESNLRSRSSTLGGWAGRLAPFRGQSIVTYHKSWLYFTNRFGLKVPVELEPKPGLEPTPGHIAGVIRTIQQNGIRAIMQEPFYSTRNANFVAQRTSAKVVVVPGSVGHTPTATSVIALFDTIVDRLAVALRA